MKQLHKDYLQNATLNAYEMLVNVSNCYLQYTKKAKESSCKAKDTESGSNTGGYFNTSICEELCYNQDQTEHLGLNA